MDTEKQANSSFSFIASHELKAPLSAMKWLLNMLQRGDVGDLNPDQAEIVGEIYKNNEQMIDLMDNIADVEELTSSNPQLDPRQFNLTQTLEHLLDQMSIFAKARNVSLKLIVESRDLHVVADERRVRDTMHNFLNNAIKYTPGKGQVKISLSAMDAEQIRDHITGEQAVADAQDLASLDGQYAVFKVVDSGIGISPEQQQQIFQKFFRSDDAIKMNTRGTGLGLFIDKLIMHLSNGIIWFHSVQGKGSAFGFALPLRSEIHKS